MTIEQQSRLRSDLSMECYSGIHMFFAFTIGLPSMLAWVAGIPFFTFLFLARDRSKFDQMLIRQKFGFLFRGYQKRYFYWEVVVMMRKTFLILMSIYLFYMSQMAEVRTRSNQS